jgi:hypothetical protein
MYKATFVWDLANHGKFMGQSLDNITSCEQEKGLKKKETLDARTLNSTTNVVANEGFTSAN